MSETQIAQLPDNPNIRHLETQVMDLTRAGLYTSVADAQFAVARRYGFTSWSNLTSYVESLTKQSMGLQERAILEGDIPGLERLLKSDPHFIHRVGFWMRRRRHNNYRPLAYAAYFGKTTAMEMFIRAGADIHEGNERALRAAASSDQNIAAAELLLKHGANPNAVSVPNEGGFRIIDFPCMTLAPVMLRCLLSHGAELNPACVGMILASNDRKPKEKSECLEVAEAAGFKLPDSAPMAIHRRDKGRLAYILDQNRDLLQQRFSEAEIFPPELEIDLPSKYAYVTPLTSGVTLLHMAVEFCDLETAAWLIEKGADPNAASWVGEDGSGGWTPLFHTVATLHVPRSFPDLAALLIRSGADPNIRASVKKPVGDGIYETYTDMTVLEYANAFKERELVNQSALQLLGTALE